jgi:hypothetical protein
MNYPIKGLLCLILQLWIIMGSARGQTEHYTIKKASFCSEVYDEYAPVSWNGGIVFCSNRSNDLFLAYKNKKQQNLFSMYYIENEGKPGWKDARPLDLNLTTAFNDGPATFNAVGDLILFSRNLHAKSGMRNFVEPGNVLGLFTASFTDSEWTNIRPFPHNNPGYSMTMPALDSAGKTLIFASDMPGGYGGTDLFLSRYADEKWSIPQNLGPQINSNSNELYPFISNNGILYFASDRPGGLGMKDIYRADPDGDGWMAAIHLEPPINSEFDDFGITCDDKFERGWFSSNRARSDDIFSFETRFRPFYGCDSIQKNHYCFLFSEGNYFENDSISVTYEWSFSDGTELDGIEVEHCFPGPGKYSVHLKIIQVYEKEDYVTETSYEFELKDHEQVVINSPDSCFVNDTIFFNGSRYNLPGFTAEEYFWDFGDGLLEIGSQVNHVYSEPGIFKIQLGLTGKDEAGDWKENCAFKAIRVKEPDN